MASFQIHDQENKKSKGNRKAQTLQSQKRSVLGELNKNAKQANLLQNNKQVACKKESSACIQQTVTQKDQTVTHYIKQKTVLQVQNIPFKIHEDVELESTEPIQNKTKTTVAGCSTRTEIQLSSEVTALYRAPLQEVSTGIQDVSMGSIPDSASPMALDKSTSGTSNLGKSSHELLLDVEEYQEDIFVYLREAETRHRPKCGYMNKQPDISHSMRSILVDWLVEVGEEYRLQTETLYLAISYIDRFLSYMSVMRAKLQLVGTAAMFIAAKYEEIYPPDVGEFVYITDDTYTKKQVLRMEHLILKVLSFDLSIPTTLSFMMLYAVTYKLADTVLYLAMYLSELALLEADPYSQFLPSEKAASAIAIALYELDQETWPQKMVDVTGYKLSQLKSCIMCLNETFSKASTCPQQAIREKYKSHRWHNVSMIIPRTPALFQEEVKPVD